MKVQTKTYGNKIIATNRDTGASIITDADSQLSAVLHMLHWNNQYDTRPRFSSPNQVRRFSKP